MPISEKVRAIASMRRSYGRTSRVWLSGCDEGEALPLRCSAHPRGPRPSFLRMTESRLRLGRRAEDLVARRLQERGWELVERNARTRTGEIDLIALDGATLVFVEVKAGRAGSPTGPGQPRPRCRPAQAGARSASSRASGSGPGALPQGSPATASTSSASSSTRRRATSMSTTSATLSDIRHPTAASSPTSSMPSPPNSSCVYAIDAKLRRCSGEMPCSRIASRCSGVE